MTILIILTILTILTGINPRNSAKKDSPNNMWNTPVGKPSLGALPSVGAKNTNLGKTSSL
jgi:hypothetical protein